ncbi:MAG: hypothetical protein WA733_08240, partial [Methylocystis sp.]
MQKVSIIGLDLAKRVFQAHGAHADGSVSFRKKLSRERLLAFLKEQPRCVVAMEACGSAHHWGRAIRDLGHEARLIPPIYVIHDTVDSTRDSHSVLWEAPFQKAVFTGFQLPTNALNAASAPISMSVRRARPRQITMVPGGESPALPR